MHARHAGSPFASSTSARLVLVVAVALAQLVAATSASAYSSLVFFGDSLTDTGNTCGVISGGGGGFAPGRCSNGYVWADYVVQDLGFGAEATSNASGGSNYANGGSRSQQFGGQIDAYLAAGGGSADPDALHSLWLGGNDVLFEVILGSSGPDAMSLAAARIGAGLQRLIDAGARHFVVANAPDVGRVYGNPLSNPPLAATPSAFGEPERTTLTALSIEFNLALADVLAGLDVETLIAIDVLGSFDEIIDDPAAFGFSPDTVDTSLSRPFPIACLADPACAADPQGAIADDFLIFDSVHPTTALHRLIADRAIAAVVPEPSTAVVIGVGLAWLGARRRRTA